DLHLLPHLCAGAEGLQPGEFRPCLPGRGQLRVRKPPRLPDDGLYLPQAGVLDEPERRDGAALRERLHLDLQERLERHARFPPGPVHMAYVKALLEPRAWYALVPDQNHSVLTAGYGTFSSNGGVDTNDYVTAARVPDGSLVMAYTPIVRQLTIDMTKMGGPTT